MLCGRALRIYGPVRSHADMKTPESLIYSGVSCSMASCGALTGEPLATRLRFQHRAQLPGRCDIDIRCHRVGRVTHLLCACHQFPGFVYAAVRLLDATSIIEVDLRVRPRRGSRPHYSRCGRVAPGYDLLSTRRFELIPIWGYRMMLLDAMRRVQCTACGVKVERVP